MNRIYFSKHNNPNEWIDVKCITVKPKWLMSLVLWVLRRLGYVTYDLR